MASTESDFRQKISDFRKQNRKEFRTDTMEFAPLRSFEDFVLTTNRFQVSFFTFMGMKTRIFD